MSQSVDGYGAWPALAVASWEPTRDTLHMYAQVVGKVRLKLAPPEPEESRDPVEELTDPHHPGRRVQRRLLPQVDLTQRVDLHDSDLGVAGDPIR